MISRRQFLSLAGVTLLGSASKSVLGNDVGIPEYYGRALRVLSVHDAPHLQAPVVQYLWPDSALQLLEWNGEWLRIPEGFVEQALVQPMLPYKPQVGFTQPNLPQWLEVAAPIAPVHAWCAANAPLVTRIGHGGVLKAVDALPTGWYAVESCENKLLGWTQAIFWQPIPEDSLDFPNAHFEISLSKHSLDVFDENRQVLSTPVATGQGLESGVYLVKQRQFGGLQQVIEGKTMHGVPWRIVFGDYQITGAYWHNTFGRFIDGKDVQVSPLIGRWLYRQMQEGSTIVVTV